MIWKYHNMCQIESQAYNYFLIVLCALAMSLYCHIAFFVYLSWKICIKTFVVHLVAARQSSLSVKCLCLLCSLVLVFISAQFLIMFLSVKRFCYLSWKLGFLCILLSCQPAKQRL